MLYFQFETQLTKNTEQVATSGSGFRKFFYLCKSIKFSIRILLLLSVFCVGIPLYAQTPIPGINISVAVSYTHLRAHETREELILSLSV